MAEPARWTNGKPDNLRAAAADALHWLDVLVAAAAMAHMPQEDYRRLKACRAALRLHVGGIDAGADSADFGRAAPAISIHAPREFVVNVAAPTQTLTDAEVDLIASGMRNAAGGIYATSKVYEFAWAIEARVRGEGGA